MHKQIPKLYLIEYRTSLKSNQWQSLPAHIYQWKAEATLFINHLPPSHRPHYRTVTFRRYTRGVKSTAVPVVG
jgi:hypothetical protein